MVEGDFTVSCTQCGGQDFQEVYPVPAVVYRVYDGSEGRSREVSPEVYACLQCGHVEHFISLEGAGGLNADAQTPRDHFDARGLALAGRRACPRSHPRRIRCLSPCWASN